MRPIKFIGLAGKALEVDEQGPHDEMIHGCVGMGGIVDVLVHIAQFGSEVWIECPA